MRPPLQVVGNSVDVGRAEIHNVSHITRMLLVYLYTLAITTFDEIEANSTQTSFDAAAGVVGGDRASKAKTGLGPGTSKGHCLDGYAPAEDAPT